MSGAGFRLNLVQMEAMINTLYVIRPLAAITASHLRLILFTRETSKFSGIASQASFTVLRSSLYVGCLPAAHLGSESQSSFSSGSILFQ